MSPPGFRAEGHQLKASTPIARVIGETLSLKRDGRFYVALCPFHGEKTPSFYVYPDHFHCFGCGAHGDVFDWLIRAHRVTFAEAVLHLAGGAHRRPLAAVSSLPRCPRKDGPLPAMVALMTDPVTGEPRGVHRTFLLSDGSGKAAVAKPKMMLGRTGVVRLEEIGVGLGLAEGIETALTVTQRIGWGPVWAASNAGAIGSFPVLPATTLNIFADNDTAGLTAAQECAARWVQAGGEVLTHTPPPGEDWADAAKRLAA
jgi:CHC2 zinc finger/Toprim domain